MFEPTRATQIHQANSHAREGQFAIIVNKINAKKTLSMQEVRIYEAMTRDHRLAEAPIKGTRIPYTVLAYQDGKSYIERVFAASNVDAMNAVQSDPRFEDQCSVRACYQGHFQHDFNFEIDESNSFNF